MTEDKFAPGPVETLARLCLQSDRYRGDADFREAVDAVLGMVIYDAAPDLMMLAIDYRDDLKRPPKGDSRDRRLDAIEAVLVKAIGRQS